MHAYLASLVVALVPVAFDPLPYSPDLASWIDVPSPNEGTADYKRFFQAAHRSRYSWVVTVEDKRVVARLQTREHFSGPKPDFSLDVEEVDQQYRRWANCATPVEDGWLVSYNAGEWLWWFSEDGKKRRRVVDYCNVNHFIRTKEGFFVVEGLSHLAFTGGSLIRLTRKDGKWVAGTFAKLPSEGLAATALADGTLLVVTAPSLAVKNEQVEFSTKIVRVTKEGKVETVLDLANWLLAPKSILVASSGVIYMGAEQYVVAYDPTAKSPALKYLVPRKDFLQSGK
jgi:hypothetical protein